MHLVQPEEQKVTAVEKVVESLFESIGDSPETKRLLQIYLIQTNKA